MFKKIKKENSTEYYYDSFTYYFEQIWKKGKKELNNIIYILLFVLKLLISALISLFSILIVKHLSPENYFCAYEIFFFIIRLCGLINSIIIDEDIKVHIFLFLAESVSLLGIIIYLELIEIKIFNLNLNLKKNIEMRSLSEYKDIKLETDLNSEDSN